jgi:hypothetical protein
MSDFRLRNLDQFRIGGPGDENSYGIPVPRTPSGKIYRLSPNPAAAPRLFLLGDAAEERAVAAEHAGRIRRQPGGGETVCPYSGVIAPDEDFLHSADLDSVKKLVAWAAEEEIGNVFENLARDFNRRQPRGGPVSVSMNFKGSHNPRPLAIREDLLRDMRCNICHRDYGVYAIALFCPDCGAPNVALHFAREGELVRQQIGRRP